MKSNCFTAIWNTHRFWPTFRFLNAFVGMKLILLLDKARLLPTLKSSKSPPVGIMVSLLLDKSLKVEKKKKVKVWIVVKHSGRLQNC